MTHDVPSVGPVGCNVSANVKRLRAARHMSLRQVSTHLTAAGRPILPIGLSRMENNQRRTDVDDLVALADLFGVAPADMLGPDATAVTRPVPHPAARAADMLAEQMTAVLADPGSKVARASLGRALARVRLEAEELLAQAPADRQQKAS